MTQFVNNDVQPGNTVFASDHNTQGALIAAVLNGGIDNDNIAPNAAISGSKLADGSISPPAINSNAFRDDSGDWKISTRIDGRKEYYRESNLTTPSLASGTSGNVTLFAAPADVNPYTALWKSLTIYDTGDNAPQALTYRLQPKNANGGNIIVRFTNPYSSTTGGATFRAAVLLIV